MANESMYDTNTTSSAIPGNLYRKNKEHRLQDHNKDDAAVVHLHDMDDGQGRQGQKKVISKSTFVPKRGLPDDDASLFTRPVVNNTRPSITHPPEHKEAIEASMLEQPETIQQMEIEIRILRDKIEAQQREMTEKDATIAILQAAKLNRNNDQVQEDKSNHRNFNSNPASTNNSSDIFIHELNVQVTIDIGVVDSTFDAQSVQAAVKEATKAALTEELSKARAACGIRNTDTMVTKTITTKSMHESPLQLDQAQANVSASSSSAASAADSSSSSSPSAPTSTVPTTVPNSSSPDDDVLTSEFPTTTSYRTPSPIEDSTVAMQQNIKSSPNDMNHSEHTSALVDGHTSVHPAVSHQKEITFVPDTGMQSTNDDDGEKSDDHALLEDTPLPQKKDETPSLPPAFEDTSHQGIALQRKDTTLRFNQTNVGIFETHESKITPHIKSPSLSPIRQQAIRRLNTKPTGLRAKKEIDPLAGHGMTIKELELTGPTVPEDEDVTLAASEFPDIESIASSRYSKEQSPTEHVVSVAIADAFGDKGVYTGKVMLKTGLPHGVGRMVYESTGRTYDGHWKNGRWHGVGQATFDNGDSYEGEYRFDKRHGRGKFMYHDGRVYEGEFNDDERHGKGFYQWPDGATYKGEFRKGLRHGHGKYIFADGTVYTGSLIDGQYDGFGECQWADGRNYVGEWKAGASHGHGVETNPDGSIRHDGIWINDQPFKP